MQDMDQDEGNHVMELCNMRCELNVFSRTHGSAMFSSGNTVVGAGVYGPVEVKPQKVMIDKASIDVYYQTKSGPSTVNDRFNESLIHKICESSILTSQYPRTGIIIVLQEIQNEGAVLSCGINSICLALIHSGLCMNYLFAAVTCVVCDNGEISTIPSLNSSESEENKKAEVMFVFESTDSKIISCTTNGPVTDCEYQESVIKCRAVASKIFEFYRNIIKNYAPRI